MNKTIQESLGMNEVLHLVERINKSQLQPGNDSFKPNHKWNHHNLQEKHISDIYKMWYTISQIGAGTYLNSINLISNLLSLYKTKHHAGSSILEVFIAYTCYRKVSSVSEITIIHSYWPVKSLLLISNTVFCRAIVAVNYKNYFLVHLQNRFYRIRQ